MTFRANQLHLVETDQRSVIQYQLVSRLQIVAIVATRVGSMGHRLLDFLVLKHRKRSIGPGLEQGMAIHAIFPVPGDSYGQRGTQRLA